MTLKKQDMRVRFAQIARDEMARLAPRGPFGRLKSSFRIFPREGTSAIVYSLYYWARFVNDGRRPVSGKRMIFFRDPEDDPRISDDYPRTRNHIRKLTKREFLAGQRKGLLVETLSVAAIQPTFFVEKAVESARKKAPKAIQKMLQDEFDRLVRRRFDSVTITIRA